MCLSPKCYIAYDDENDGTKKGTKGVPGSCKITLQEFKDKLYNNQTPTVEVRSLRTVDGQMARTTQRKKGLSDLYCKYRIDSDRITCRALTENGKYM